METDIDKRYQTLLILWCGLLMSIAGFFLFSWLAAPQIGNQSTAPPGLIVAFAGLGILIVIMSVVVKRKFLQRSIDQQDVALVHTALIVGCAMCEVVALLGLLEHFIFGYSKYYLLFLVAAAGVVLHIPRRQQLLLATYKTYMDKTGS